MRQSCSCVAARTGLQGASEVGDVPALGLTEDEVPQGNLDDLAVVPAGVSEA